MKQRKFMILYSEDIPTHEMENLKNILRKLDLPYSIILSTKKIDCFTRKELEKLKEILEETLKT